MKKVSGVLPYFIFITALTVFYAHFTFSYMRYFNIGLNNGTRIMDIYLVRAPIAMFFQIMTLLVFDKFVSRHNAQWRIWLNLIVLFGAVCIVFFGFSLYSNGITREGGFIRFLGYYFLELKPGQIPSG
jgi:hypothetical protein